jgi:hypothetical protein
MRHLWLVIASACSPTYTLDELPITEWTAGLPVSGDGELVVNLWGPHPDDWRYAVGEVMFACRDCVLGDDHAKLDIAFWDEKAIDFGRLALGDVGMCAAFEGGRVDIVARWRSVEFELDAHVRGVLARDASNTELDGCVVFRGLEPLRARDPKVDAMVSLAGAPRDETGRFAIKIEGTLGEMKRLAQLCEPAAGPK